MLMNTSDNNVKVEIKKDLSQMLSIIAYIKGIEKEEYLEELVLAGLKGKDRECYIGMMGALNSAKRGHKEAKNNKNCRVRNIDDKKILELKNENFTANEIGKIMGIGRSTVFKIIKEKNQKKGN